jgi:mannitol-specific phosphotransferase system IIBC component
MSTTLQCFIILPSLLVLSLIIANIILHFTRKSIAKDRAEYNELVAKVEAEQQAIRDKKAKEELDNYLEGLRK